MSFKDISNNIERMEMLEERFGIRLQGLMAALGDLLSDGVHRLSVSGEIYLAGSGTLKKNVELQIVAQNSAGQVVGVSSIRLDKDVFSGYSAFDELLLCKGCPVRVKFVPTNSSF